MTTVVDSIFAIVLAVFGADGNLAGQNSFAFPNKAACVSFRGEAIDFVTTKTVAERQGQTYYISDCTAVPLAVVK